MALARVDPDAAWSQLSAALQAVSSGASGSSAPPAALSGSEAEHAPLVPADVALRSSGEPLAFPERQQIAPPLPPEPAAPAGGGRRRGEAAPGLCVPPGLREVSAAKLAAMLRQVEQLPPRWHKQVEALLERP